MGQTSFRSPAGQLPKHPSLGSRPKVLWGLVTRGEAALGEDGCGIVVKNEITGEEPYMQQTSLMALQDGRRLPSLQKILHLLGTARLPRD